MGFFQTAIKRALDIAVASLALLLCSPLLCVIALVVRRSSVGPALFRQARLGHNGRPFVALKFRTMVIDAPDLRNADGSAFNSAHDARVTKYGNFLRRTSLDELPQLFNVLKGEMSLVGPRPDQLDQIQYYTEAEKARLLVLPGVTGLAQINGRNSISWQARKQMDIAYVRRQSLWLDLTIICKTVPYVFCRRDVFINQTTAKEAL